MLLGSVKEETTWIHKSNVSGRTKSTGFQELPFPNTIGCGHRGPRMVLLHAPFFVRSGSAEFASLSIAPSPPTGSVQWLQSSSPTPRGAASPAAVDLVSTHHHFSRKPLRPKEIPIPQLRKQILQPKKLRYNQTCLQGPALGE